MVPSNTTLHSRTAGVIYHDFTISRDTRQLRLHYAQLRALGPRAAQHLAIAYKLTLVADAAENLAVVVEADQPHGRLVGVKL